MFDRTGAYAITGSDDRLVKIWSMETGLCLRSCRGHTVRPNLGRGPRGRSARILTLLRVGVQGDITELSVSFDNALVASASNDHVIRVVSAASRTHGSGAGYGYGYGYGYGHDVLLGRQWALPRGEPVSILRGHEKPVTAIAFSPRRSTHFALLS